MLPNINSHTMYLFSIGMRLTYVLKLLFENIAKNRGKFIVCKTIGVRSISSHFFLRYVLNITHLFPSLTISTPITRMNHLLLVYPKQQPVFVDHKSGRVVPLLKTLEWLTISSRLKIRTFNMASRALYLPLFTSPAFCFLSLGQRDLFSGL